MFQLQTDTFHGLQKMGIETRLIIHCWLLLNSLTSTGLPLSRDIHYLTKITVSL
jgi:hypothetical protein